MNAVIMAGGYGTRLKSISGDLPKPMVDLAGKPVLEHTLLLLRRNGIENVCMSLHYSPEVIREYFGSGEKWGMRISYHVEPKPLGTAGGVKACRDFTGSRDFLVISGDCVCNFDLRVLMEAHRRHGSAVTMALVPHSAPLSYGIVLTDNLGRVVSFTEKPRWRQVVSDMINTGIYVISPKAMELVPEGEPYDFSKQLFPALLEKGTEIRALPMEGYWCDIGTPRAYHQCCIDAIDGRIFPDSPDSEASPDSEPEESGCECRCKDRARTMRVISQALMEAGADFSDGLTLPTPEGRVTITPSGKNESIIIGTDCRDPEISRQLTDKFRKFIDNTGAFE